MKELEPFHFSMLASYVRKSVEPFVSKAFLWIRNPTAENFHENVTIGFEDGQVYIAARAKDSHPGVYDWAIIAQSNAGPMLQIRDENGDPIHVDLRSAAVVLNRLIDAEYNARGQLPKNTAN